MRETMKVIFIAGPFSLTAIEVAWQYKKILAKNFVGVFYSFDLGIGVLDIASAYFKHLCGIFLRTTASAVLVLPGWEQNEIAKDVVAYAKKYNLDIFYPKLPNIDDKELRKAISWGRAPWLMTLKK